VTSRVPILLALFTVAGCSSPASDARFTEAVPDRAQFPAVAQGMERKCGALDCHGSSYRNLRVYGNESLRWLPTDRVLSPPCTTSLEVEQDFDSLVGLEPEAMTTVVQDHGAGPDRLLLVRKARGTEGHKGGVVMNAGDDLDVCITSWLAGATNVAACEKAGPPTIPPPKPGEAPACRPGP
jgi:hypothetical protein